MLAGVVAACGGSGGDDVDAGSGTCLAVEVSLPLQVSESLPVDAPDLAGSCAGAGVPQRAYRFVTAADGAATVRVEALETWSPVIYLRAGCEGAEQACWEAAGSLLVASACVTGGQEYVLFVDGAEPTAAGDFTLDLSTAACLEGATCATDRCFDELAEACADALPLTAGTTRYGTTTGATDDVDGRCEIAGPDTAYYFVAPSTGVATFSVSASWGAVVDVRGACDGDLRACGNALSGGPSVDVCVVEGATYQVVVDGWMDTDQGDYAITTSMRDCSAADACISCQGHGDVCADPLPLTIGDPVTGDTRGAADDYSACGNAGEPDVVYQFVAPSTGRLDLRVQADPSWIFHPRAYVAAPCPSGVISCTGQAGDDFIMTSACVEAGQTYSIIVDGSSEPGEDRGPFTMTSSITACPGSCVVDACQ